MAHQQTGGVDAIGYSARFLLQLRWRARYRHAGDAPSPSLGGTTKMATLHTHASSVVPDTVYALALLQQVTLQNFSLSTAHRISNFPKKKSTITSGLRRQDAHPDTNTRWPSTMQCKANSACQP